MINRPSRSKRRHREFADDIAFAFEYAPAQNTIHEAILDDTQLAQLCDVAAAAYNASARQEGTHGPASESVEDLEEAWITIDDVARQRALEVGAEACASVIQHGEQWDEEGHWNTETIHNAIQEAREWLQEHTDAANQANVEEVLVK